MGSRYTKIKEEKDKEKIEDLIIHAMESMNVAATIIDTQGTLLYYNKQAAKILDRKPGYIGQDIHSHHKKPNSNKKLDLMLKDFQKKKDSAFSLRSTTLRRNNTCYSFTYCKGWKLYRLYSNGEAQRGCRLWLNNNRRASLKIVLNFAPVT